MIHSMTGVSTMESPAECLHLAKENSDLGI